MRRAAAWLALGLLAPVSALAAGLGERAPAFTAPTFQGGERSLESLQGKVVLINFWATWCGPCREELPRLEEMYRRHRERGFVVLGVNVDGSRKHDKARALARRLGLSFPLVFDPKQEIPERYAIEKMPSSYLVDRKGVVRYVHAGYRAGDEAKIEAAVRRALSRSASRGTPPSASE